MKRKTLFLLGLLPLAMTACVSQKPTTNNTVGSDGGTNGTTVINSDAGKTDDDNGKTNTDDNGGNQGNKDDDKPIVDDTKSAYTVLIYMCGSDLESDSQQGGLATSDIQEILSVKNQPKDVNIVIQTGGAKKWSSAGQKLGISYSKSQRWHVEDGKLVKDEETTKKNMGLSSTLESFLTWGIEKYPAEKTGVVLWNHGGGMYGVCYDEQFDNDNLLNSEVNKALENTFTTLKRTEKLEFIGYDACLMAVQDIAEFNSKYFNYMIASEESEAGYGWDYDNWVDDLYAKKSTREILFEICDTFIEDNNVDYYGNYSTAYNDQTLSVLDLSKMDAYKKAFEDFGDALTKKVSSSKKSTVKTVFNKAKRYAVDDDNSQDYFGTYDAKDLLTKVKANSTINPGDEIVDAAITAFGNLVIHNSVGKKAGNSNGLCCYYAATRDASRSTVYTTKETHFSNWISVNSTLGY